MQLYLKPLKKLNLQDVRAENGRILCRGTEADIPRMNINLRTGARVLLVLSTFKALSFEDLFQGVKAIPWEDMIPTAVPRRRRRSLFQATTAPSFCRKAGWLALLRGPAM